MGISMPQLFMIGGPNGAGKTTCAMDLLPGLLECEEYVNADAIAAGLSPFRPEATAIQAGRLMLQRIHHLAAIQKDFAFESTLASKSFVPFLRKCQQDGYSVMVIFLWLESVDLALSRVAGRVLSGGHSVSEEVVKRRYSRGAQNFFRLYRPLANHWAVYDNSTDRPILVARKELGGAVIVENGRVWNKLMEAFV